MLKFDLKRFHFNNPEIISDPYPLYRELLAERPIFFTEMYGGAWIVTRYADVALLLTDKRLSSQRAAVPVSKLSAEEKREFASMIEVFSRWVAFFDAPHHAPKRKLLGKGITPFTADALRPRVASILDALIEPLAGSGSLDIVKDVAYPLPALLIAELLGAPREDYRQLIVWADDIAHLFGSSEVTLEMVRRTRKSAFELFDYLRRLVEETKSRPGDTIIGRLLLARDGDLRFSEDDIAAQCILLLFAGLESARYLIGNGFLALFEHPDEMRKLKENPSLVASAVEEFLRYDNPIQFIARTAKEDFELHGHAIQRGSVVLPVVGAANRDPAQFSHPDRLDIARTENKHLAFGQGPHLCIGATIVRVQVQMAFNVLLERMPAMRLPPQELDWNANLGFRGLRSLRVEL
ncbi:cytochrome P450 [Sorangium sp. So ce1099]|uniref:cytochrome P450 n=1 Tax=Sorangium sp. So ce1099 TaxID=3133331 RepID=UPI003F5F53BF